MLRSYKIVTLTHKQSKLSQLSSFMLQHNQESELRDQLQDLKRAFGITELLYLATCNRVAFFMELPGNVDPDFLSRFCQQINPKLGALEKEELLAKVRLLEGNEAIQHLLEVAASIDSMVVGEREILRQLREAYERCKTWGLTGDNIRLAMRTTVETAKEVYAKTRIGEKPVSIVSLAIQQLLQTKLSTQARILLIGAGQTNTLVAKFLLKHGFQNVVVFNRSIGKAKKLAGLLPGARSALLDDLKNYQEGFEAIITCTGHTQPWIDESLYRALLGEDSQKKLVIDLAVPNNFCETVRQNFDLHYIEVEALRQLARENIAFREQEVLQARQLIEQQLTGFYSLFQQRSIERAMRQVPAEIKAVKSHAMNEVFRKELEHLNPESRQLLERMMDYMEKRCISIPMQAAKRLAK